jgi:hypothetical protein
MLMYEYTIYYFFTLIIKTIYILYTQNTIIKYYINFKFYFFFIQNIILILNLFFFYTLIVKTVCICKVL